MVASHVLYLFPDGHLHEKCAKLPICFRHDGRLSAHFVKFGASESRWTQIFSCIDQLPGVSWKLADNLSWVPTIKVQQPIWTCSTWYSLVKFLCYKVHVGLPNTQFHFCPYLFYRLLGRLLGELQELVKFSIWININFLDTLTLHLRSWSYFYRHLL